jgi:hypothetical protein
MSSVEIYSFASHNLQQGAKQAHTYLAKAPEHCTLERYVEQEQCRKSPFPHHEDERERIVAAEITAAKHIKCEGNFTLVGFIFCIIYFIYICLFVVKCSSSR